MAKVAGAEAAKGAGTRLRAGYCLTSLSEGHRKFRGKRPADGQSSWRWAAKGAGARLRAGYCLTSLSEAHRKSRESARQMAKVAGAGPPRAPGHV